MNDNILSGENITKRFGGLVAVNDVSFTLKKGEILGLIGPNGAGKTTLFNIISGYYRPEEGKVYFKGEDVTGKRPYEMARRGVGRTFQIVKPLQALSVLDNVTISALLRHGQKEKAAEKAKEVLEFTGLYDMRFNKAGSLNLEEKKTLELSRALALEPELLLLDEVGSGLNPTEIDEVLTLLRKISSRGITMLIVEHVMRAIMNISQRILVLHHGSKLAEGTPAEIAKDVEVVEAYLGSEQA